MNQGPPPAPREWLEGWPWPWPATRSLPDGAVVRACFGIVSLQLSRTRNEQPYLRLTLTDRYGVLEARLWERAEAVAEGLHCGLYVGVQGRVEHFNGELQLCLDRIEPIRVELEDLPLFLPHSPRPAAEMERQLQQLVASVQDAPLRHLLHACVGAQSELGPGFRLAPAAKLNHHAYLGGLLEHTLSVATVCDRLAEHYAGMDRDLLVAAALLHDLGKVREIGARPGFPYTDEGKLLGHILIGLDLVTAAARKVPALSPERLLLLQHLIASHQGRYEWQSPREPATLEAIILHYVDDLDAKLQQVRGLLDQGEGPWTSCDRTFRREFLRYLRSADPAARTADTQLGDRVAEAKPDAVDPVPPKADGPASPVRARAPGSTRSEPTHRGPHGQRANGLHNFAEDTLDLFGSLPDT